MKNLYRLFELALNFMEASGGDGSVVVVFDKPTMLANLFESWCNSNTFTRTDIALTNSCIFARSQESIIFASELLEQDCFAYEFVAILPNWYEEFIQQEVNSIKH